MNIDKKKTIKISVIVVSALLFLSLGFFLTYRYWSPMGKKLKLNFTIKDGKIKPTETAKQDANSNFDIPAQIIQSATTRFTMDVGTGEIESITAKLKFKQGPKEIKLGIRGNEKDKFVYKPFYQKLLQECTWTKTEEATKILYQKTKKYDNIGQLINNPPDYRQIATYNIHSSVLMQKILANGIDQKNQKPIDIKTGLRGNHTFIIRVDKAPFIFKLSKQDINMYAGEDKYVISINRDGRLIEEKSIADDGFIGTEKLKKDSQSIEFNLTDIEPGIYEVNANIEGKGDSVITQVESNQSRIVIKNSVFSLYGKPMILYTNASPLTMTVAHKEYTQTVKLNDTIPLELKKEGEKTVFEIEKLVKDKKPNDLYKLETPKTDVIFSNTGYFAFSPEQYFDPEVIRGTDLNTVASLDEIDYILTSIPKATQAGDWLVSEVTFDPKDIKIDENKKLYFSLEMPDLAKYSGELEIESFEVEVKTKGALSDKFGKKEPTPTKAIATPTSEPAKANTPTPNPATAGPTLAPINTPSFAVTKAINIKIQNSGAVSGTATKYSDLLKSVGYTNITATNSSTKIKNATISFPQKYQKDADYITQLVKKEYKIINQSIDYKNDFVTLILGSL